MSSILTLADSAVRATQIYRTFDDGAPPLLVPTGFASIDREIGGFPPETNNVITAHTGVGKSTVMLRAAMAQSDLGWSAGVVSLEDTADVVGMRAIAADSGVSIKRMRLKQLTAPERDRVAQSIERLRASLVRAVYAISQPLEKIADAIRHLADEGCQVVYIDYLQAIFGGEASADRRNEVAYAVSRLHGVAAERGLPIVLVSQLKRPVFDKNGAPRRPTRYDCAETSAIETKCRSMMVFWRPEPENRNLVEGWLEKCNFGEEGVTFELVREPSGMLVERVAPPGEAESWT